MKKFNLVEVAKTELVLEINGLSPISNEISFSGPKMYMSHRVYMLLKDVLPNKGLENEEVIDGQTMISLDLVGHSAYYSGDCLQLREVVGQELKLIEE